MTVWKGIGWGILALVSIYAIGFLMTGGNLAIYRFWAPQFRAAQREVFEQSQSYVQGKVSYLNRLLLEHDAASGERRESLRRLILAEAAQIDDNLLPATLRSRLNAIR